MEVFCEERVFLPFELGEISRLSEVNEELADFAANHVIGGSIFGTGALFIGNTSAEQKILYKFNKHHSIESLINAADDAKKVFSQFIKTTVVKIFEKGEIRGAAPYNPLPPSLLVKPAGLPHLARR